MAASAQYSVVSVRFTGHNVHVGQKIKTGRLEVTEGCPPPVLTALHQTLIDLNVCGKDEQFSLDTKAHLWIHTYRIGEDSLVMSQHLIRCMLQRNYRMTGATSEDGGDSTNVILFFTKDAGTVGSIPAADHD